MKKISKYIILSLMFMFLFSVSVYASGYEHVIEENQEERDNEEYDKAISGFNDLGSMHIVVDENNNVSIKEVSDIKGNGTGNGAVAQRAINTTLQKYRSFIIGVSGLCTLTFVLIFLVTFTKIAANPSNPQQKAELSKSLVWIGLGAAGFGAITLIVGFGLGFFQSLGESEIAPAASMIIPILFK